MGATNCRLTLDAGDGTSVKVFKISDGFSVSIYDEDAGETFPVMFKFADETKALAKAREISRLALAGV